MWEIKYVYASIKYFIQARFFKTYHGSTTKILPKKYGIIPALYMYFY